MIGQYLPQTNESGTVVKSKNFSHLNKAQVLGFITNLLALMSISLPLKSVCVCVEHGSYWVFGLGLGLLGGNR